VPNEEMAANRRHWDEVVPIHAASKFYDLEGFKKGKSSLLPVELEEVGQVDGKSLLHLQCHFGMDTLSWARLGAKVTGIDYSGEAIHLARSIAKETGIDARFIESNIYDLDSSLKERFDIVYTSYGVLCWLPDLKRWADQIRNHLKEGGFFYIVEDHPLASTIDEESADKICMNFPYFSPGEALKFELLGTYTDRSVRLKNKTSYEWPHPLSEIVNSLLEAGLSIEFLHEFPFGFFKRHPQMSRRADGTWHFDDPAISFPMMFSIKARI